MDIITPATMSYKNLKKENELLAKLQIVKLFKIKKISKVAIAKSFECHRNTVTNIIKDFEHIPKSDQKILLTQTNNIETIKNLMGSLNSKSTRPIGRHPKQATVEQETKIVDIFNNYLSVGYKRMKRHIDRSFGRPGNNHRKVSSLERSLTKLSLAQIKGIYKRNNLQIKKRRSVNGEVRHIYDYSAIAAFEYMHIDTKHILDQGALPSEIYEKFQLNDELPIYEWNIMDAKSRFRFIAYSHNLSSEFGFKLLVSTIQYIRGLFSNYDLHINILTDSGTEFYGGSIRKEEKWNKVLNVMNASIESYEIGNDIRKNLIERSHKSDDEDFYISRGQFIHDRRSFLKEARGYQYYWNAQRSHNGIDMNDRTPLEVLADSGLISPHRLLNYPTMILEEDVPILSDITNVVELKAHLEENYELVAKFDQKKIRNLILKFPFLSKSAQNVLTHYR